MGCDPDYVDAKPATLWRREDDVVTTELMRSVDERSRAALASSARQPIETGQLQLMDGGLRFIVRWVSTLARKDGAATVIPGGPRDPNFNPFLSPEPALTVGPLGDTHTAILNKFPVCSRHLVIASRAFAEQLSPLDLNDFTALAQVLVQCGGLGFFNGGAAAGASQRHKHVQWIPPAPDNASLAELVTGLPKDAAECSLAQHPRYPMKHCFVRVRCDAQTAVSDAAQSLLRACERGYDELGLRVDAAGLLPPYNLLVGDGWMLMVPRSREHYEGISINALSYGGVLFVRQPEQIEVIKTAGPIAVLADVGCRW